jgi:hypothetical protein
MLIKGEEQAGGNKLFLREWRLFTVISPILCLITAGNSEFDSVSN